MGSFFRRRPKLTRAVKLTPSFGGAVAACFPQEMVERLGWRPGTEVFASIENGALVVRSDPSNKEADAHVS